MASSPSRDIPDPWLALGLERDATPQQIRSAWRKASLRTHPDKSDDPAALDKFQAIQDAYDILRDEGKRERFVISERLQRLRREALQKRASSESTSNGPRARSYATTSYFGEERPVYEERKPSRRRFDDESEDYFRKSPDQSERRLPDTSTDTSSRRARRADTDRIRRERSRPLYEDERRERRAYAERETTTSRPRDTASRFTADRRPARTRPRNAGPQPVYQPRPPNKQHAKGRLVLPGYINGHYVETLPDTGAEQNIMAESFADKRGLPIKPLEGNEPRSFTLPNKKTVQILGTTTADWCFEDDRTKTIPVKFYVLAECVVDVILGCGFLFDTETVNKHTSRLRRVARPENSMYVRQVNVLGNSRQRIRGTLESTRVLALPDSGAEPNIISMDYAMARGWLFDPSPDLVHMVQYADGSLDETIGQITLDWVFGYGLTQTRNSNDRRRHQMVTFSVLRNCSVDVILGQDFLDDTDAFTLHQSCLEVLSSSITTPSLAHVMWLGKKHKEKQKAQKEAQRSQRERTQPTPRPKPEGRPASATSQASLDRAQEFHLKQELERKRKEALQKEQLAQRAAEETALRREQARKQAALKTGSPVGFADIPRPPKTTPLPQPATYPYQYSQPHAGLYASSMAHQHPLAQVVAVE